MLRAEQLLYNHFPLLNFVGAFLAVGQRTGLGAARDPKALVHPTVLLQAPRKFEGTLSTFTQDHHHKPDWALTSNTVHRRTEQS